MNKWGFPGVVGSKNMSMGKREMKTWGPGVDVGMGDESSEGTTSYQRNIFLLPSLRMSLLRL